MTEAMPMAMPSIDNDGAQPVTNDGSHGKADELTHGPIPNGRPERPPGRVV